MTSISLGRIEKYRSLTFHLAPEARLKRKEEAIEFVKERGFIYFWPIRDILLPSLWAAVAGDRPVADAHDDPGHVTWGWKDSLLGQQAWYYAKILRKKATMISMQVAPFFYALSENYGAPEEDYLTLYEQGRLTLEAKAVYEALLDHGPLDTITLRKTSHLTSRDSEARFNKALADLQADFKVVPVGVTEAGAWHYAFSYEIVARQYPDLIEQARYIGELDARRKLAELYFRSVGAAQARDLAKLFGWSHDEVNQTIVWLVKAGSVQNGVEIEGRVGEWIVLKELLK
jgi:hypothetical protein